MRPLRSATHLRPLITSGRLTTIAQGDVEKPCLGFIGCSSNDAFTGA